MKLGGAALLSLAALTACTSSPTSATSPTASSAHPSSTAPAPGSTPASSAVSSTATPSIRPVPTTAVPAPTPGNLHQTVPAVRVVTAKAVPLTATATFDRTLTARIVAVDRVRATGRIPGEISGAALSLQVSLQNRSKVAVDTNDVVVAVSDGRGQPLGLLETATHRIPNVVAAGGTGSGVYIFHLTNTFANPAMVDVSYSTRAPVLVFVGTA